MVLDYVNKLQIPVISLLVGIFVVSNFFLLKTVLGGSLYKKLLPQSPSFAYILASGITENDGFTIIVMNPQNSLQVDQIN